MIFVGSGVYGAEAELLEVAEMLQAPVVSYRGGRGAVSDRHYLSLTQPAGHRLWADADAVLAVGTRLHHQRLGWGLDDGLKIVHVDIDPVEIRRVSRPAVGLVADAKQALAALALELPRHNRARASREAELSTLKAEVAAEIADKLAPQCAYLRVLREVLPDDGILVNELTQVGYAAMIAYPVYAPRTLLSSGYQGTLGFGFATALGAKIANPDKKVLSINGDGGFMYNVQELATAVKHGIGVVVVVFNDNAFGNVRRMQTELYDGKVIASELANPDFVRLAESFGIPGHRAHSPEELSPLLRQALDQPGPSLIEVPMGVMPDPWPLIMPRRVRPSR